MISQILTYYGFRFIYDPCKKFINFNSSRRFVIPKQVKLYIKENHLQHRIQQTKLHNGLINFDEVNYKTLENTLDNEISNMNAEDYSFVLLNLPDETPFDKQTVCSTRLHDELLHNEFNDADLFSVTSETGKAKQYQSSTQNAKILFGDFNENCAIIFILRSFRINSLCIFLLFCSEFCKA